MNPRPIIDAGPSLNFFATNRERLLFRQVGSLHMPETVRHEVSRKAKRDRRFASAGAVLAKLPAELLDVLSDDSTPELDAVVTRIDGIGLVERRTKSMDLGELMVVAHAVVAAEAGFTITVLIDERAGRRLAISEVKRLDRLRTQGGQVGSIRLNSTTSVLESAARTPEIPGRAEMRSLYQRMR